MDPCPSLMPRELSRLEPPRDSTLLIDLCSSLMPSESSLMPRESSPLGSCTIPRWTELPPHLPLCLSCHVLRLWRPCSRGLTVTLPSLSTRIFATLLSTSIVGNTLSPMLQTAGTTVLSRRKLFNRPQLISPFSSSCLETT